MTIKVNHFHEESDQDRDPDTNSIKKLDPDPHESDADPQPYSRNAIPLQHCTALKKHYRTVNNNTDNVWYMTNLALVQV